MKKILRYDASALVQSACGLRLKLMLIDGVREKMLYNDVVYGQGLHTFMATVAETKGDLHDSIVAAKKTFNIPCLIRGGKKHLNEFHLIKTCLDYWEHCSKTDDFEILLNEDGKPCVEMYFEHKVYEDDELIIYLCGTIDKIGKFKNGIYAIGDYKTHTLFAASKYGIEDFFKKFALSTQTHFYLHNLYLKALESPSSMLADICKHYNVGFFIDGIFLSGTDKTMFERSEVIVPKKSTMDEFNLLLLSAIHKLVSIHKSTGKIAREGLINGACVDGKYLCKYWHLCVATDDIIRGHILKNEFTVKEYNPAMHGRE